MINTPQRKFDSAGVVHESVRQDIVQHLEEIHRLVGACISGEDCSNADVAAVEQYIRSAVPQEDRITLVHSLRHPVKQPLAERLFGQKLSHDIGLVTTADHPKTDFGEPGLGSAWDLDVK